MKYPNGDFSYANFLSGYYEGHCLKYNKRLDQTRACKYRQGALKKSFEILDGKPTELILLEYGLDGELDVRDLEKMFGKKKNLFCNFSEKNIFIGSCKEITRNNVIKHGVCYKVDVNSGLLEYGVYVDDQLNCFGRRTTRNFDSWTGNFIRQKGI